MGGVAVEEDEKDEKDEQDELLDASHMSGRLGSIPLSCTLAVVFLRRGRDAWR